MTDDPRPAQHWPGVDSVILVQQRSHSGVRFRETNPSVGWVACQYGLSGQPPVTVTALHLDDAQAEAKKLWPTITGWVKDGPNRYHATVKA